MKMSKRARLAAAGGTLVLAGFAGGAVAGVTGSASAVGDTLSSVGSGPDGRGEELLTGTTAEKVTAAVEAEYPNATIERVETDSDGVYEAHIVTSAGAALVVQVDKDFAITGTQAGGHGFGGGHGPGGPGGPGGFGEEPLTGTTADKVTAAVEAEYPNATIQRVETDSEGVYEAHIVTSAGEALVVQVDKDFAITGTQAGVHGFGGGHGFDDQDDDGAVDDGVGGDAA